MSNLDAEGWWSPNGRKYHYVKNELLARTLCGKWAYVGGLVESGQDDHPDNCAACKRKRLAALEAKP